MHNIQKIYYSSHTREFMETISTIKNMFPSIRTYQRSMTDKYQINMNDGSIVKGKDAVNMITNLSYAIHTDEHACAIIYNNNVVFNHIEVLLNSIYKPNPLYNNYLFILGYNVMPDTINSLRKKYPNRIFVAMQFEQLFDGSRWVTKKSINILKECDEIWDYDQNNIDFLYNSYNIKAKLHLLQYVPELECIPLLAKNDHDIDILFYGSMNEHRHNIINKLKEQLPERNIVTVDAWGKELDNYIQRAKIILNIHYYEPNRQEQARMFYLLCNHKCVVSETSTTNYYGDAIVESSEDNILDTCKYLLNNDIWYSHALKSTEKFKNISINTHYTDGENTIKVLIAMPIYKRELLALNSIRSIVEKTSTDNIDVTIALGVNEMNNELESYLNNYINNSHLHIALEKFSSNLGKGGAINKLASLYDFDYMISIDSDMICIDSNWLKNMIYIYKTYNKTNKTKKIGSLCTNQTGANCHAISYNDPNMIRTILNKFTIISHTSGRGVAGGVLMTDKDTWNSIGGYKAHRLYASDDGHYHGDCHTLNKLVGYVDEIYFFHPYEFNDDYRVWKDKLLIS